MLIRIVSFSLICLMVNLTLSTSVLAADSDSDKAAKKAAKNAKREAKRAKRLAKIERKITKHATKVKTGVIKLGVGPESKVKVKLWNKTKIKGYISKIDENSFTITDASGTSTTVEYRNAKQIKGNNLHAGVWIAIGAGIALATLVIIFAILLGGDS